MPRCRPTSAGFVGIGPLCVPNSFQGRLFFVHVVASCHLVDKRNERIQTPPLEKQPFSVRRERLQLLVFRAGEHARDLFERHFQLTID